MDTSAATNDNLNASLRLSAEGRRAMRSPTREGLVNGFYNDGGKTKGNCTFGVGIKVHDGPCSAKELNTPLTSVQIEAAFTSAVIWAENGVKRHVKKQALTQEQFDALVSFVFNVGIGRSIAVLHRIDHGELNHAAAIMTSMNTSKQNGKPVFMRGLVKRRQEETAPFRVNP